MTKYDGNCLCGSVKFEVEGEPHVMAVCHCTICRSWSASPVNGASLWKPENFNVTSGEELLQNYSYSKGHKRTWCSKCGGHVFTDHAETYGFIDVYASVLNNFKFIPALHLNYENTILPIKDGLPKFKDFPEDFGGSGETMNE